jgi:tetratricopeptide (TPR) repeat protein
MSTRIALFLLLGVSTLAFARDKTETWTRVSTQHFTIYCDGNEKDGRKIADQLERMRAMFQTAFPDMKVDPPSPILVLAVKNEKGFRALEPEAYLAKGQLQLAGLFLPAPDKNYVLLRMDAPGEHPYATVYHEYTHLLFSKAQDWLPLWLNEGMAEYYQNTELRDKDTILGEASTDDILWLRQNRLLPLTTLLTVDRNSPYYHEEQKGSIFYSESWALTHYLHVKDAENNTHRVSDYVSLMSKHSDSVAAATQVFGDLKQLQAALERYISQSNFKAFRLNKPLPVDDTTFKVQSISETQADAVRADFLAYNQREKDARALLDQLLHDDPNSTLAHETMGYLEFRAGNLDKAQNWYEQAVKLDSQSYLANYYYASIAMQRGSSDADAQIESSLQKAIKLNPSFAPSYDQLATFYGMRHKNMDQARMLSLQATQLDPGNVRYRVTGANLLANMQRPEDAVTVLQAALKLAKNPEEAMMVQNQLDSIQQYMAMRENAEENNRGHQEDMKSTNEASLVSSSETTEAPPALERELKGPRHFITGTVKHVHCSPPASLALDIDDGQATLSLRTSNYYKLVFTAFGFTPNGALHPCSDLEGAHAKVGYAAATEPGKNGRLVSVELHK